MDYDPFVRGPFCAGVTSGRLIDPNRDNRQLPFEVWYPAAAQYAGLDLSTWTQDSFTVVPGSAAFHQAAMRDAATHPGRYPLILFSHASGGHRRQSSFLCTHLASHGYVVAAVDHTGNTAVDFAARANRVAAGEVSAKAEIDARIQQLIADRVPDLRSLLEELLAGGAGEISDHIDDQRIGLIGWSFGGWAVLAALEVDDRFGAVVALAPAGNSNPLPGIIPATLTFAWKRAAPVLYLAGERDRFTPLPGIHELCERTPSRKKLFLLRDAGHLHFGDSIDEYDLCLRQHAHFFTRGLSLAHLDAALKENHTAQQFMADDAETVLRERGVNAILHEEGGQR